MRMRTSSPADELIDNCDYLIKDSIDFKNDNRICLEIGMGKGDFIIGMALNNPDTNYIGMEMHSNVLSLAIKKINEYNLDNLRIIRMDAKDSVDLLKDKIDTIFLNFSDPWPKKRHEKRRLSSKQFLDRYDKIFKNENKIQMKTDNDDLYEYSCISFIENGYEIIKTDTNYKDTITTEYEDKFMGKGKNINYIYVVKK